MLTRAATGRQPGRPDSLNCHRLSAEMTTEGLQQIIPSSEQQPVFVPLPASDPLASLHAAAFAPLQFVSIPLPSIPDSALVSRGSRGRDHSRSREYRHTERFDMTPTVSPRSPRTPFRAGVPDPIGLPIQIQSSSAPAATAADMSSIYIQGVGF